MQSMLVMLQLNKAISVVAENKEAELLAKVDAVTEAAKIGLKRQEENSEMLYDDVKQSLDNV